MTYGVVSSFHFTLEESEVFVLRKCNDYFSVIQQIISFSLSCCNYNSWTNKITWGGVSERIKVGVWMLRESGMVFKWFRMVFSAFKVSVSSCIGIQVLLCPNSWRYFSVLNINHIPFALSHFFVDSTEEDLWYVLSSFF